MLGCFSPCRNGLVRGRGSRLGAKATMFFGVTPRTCAFHATREVAGTGVAPYCVAGVVPARARELLEVR